MSTPLIRPSVLTRSTSSSPSPTPLRLGIKPPREMYVDGFRRWYRPEWSWVALRAGEVIARVAFTGAPDTDRPEVMGSLEIGTRPDRIETGTMLARTRTRRCPGRGPAPLPPVPAGRLAGARRLPGGRRGPAHRGAHRRPDVSHRAPATRPGGGDRPAAPGRPAELPAGRRRGRARRRRATFTGTFDSGTRRRAEQHGLDAAVRSFVGDFPRTRSLGRLAYDAAGACVGIVAPDPGDDRWGPDIAYLGVLPEHRGRGYADDLLIEASHLLVEHGAEDIGSTTDAGNVPMAAAFARCEFQIVDRLIVCG